MLEELAHASVQGSILWIPMMAEDDRPAAEAAAGELADLPLCHLWDGERKAGDAFARTLGLHAVAWDVYLLYGPEASWEEELPPAPHFWMGQLPRKWGLAEERLLRPGELARELAALAGKEAALGPDLALRLHAQGIATARRAPGAKA